jgi:hypothetical protein
MQVPYDYAQGGLPTLLRFSPDERGGIKSWVLTNQQVSHRFAVIAS